MNAASEMAAFALRRESGVGCFVGGFTVSSGDIALLDQRMRQLNQDINSQARDMAMVVRWTDFFAQWEIWRANHTSTLSQSDIPILGDENVGFDFQTFTSSYNEWLREATAAGIETAAGKDISDQTVLDKFTTSVQNAVQTMGILGAIGVAVAAGVGLVWVGSKVGHR